MSFKPTPCAYCGRGARNPITCKLCSGMFTATVFCCERCFNAHYRNHHEGQQSQSETKPSRSGCAGCFTALLIVIGLPLLGLLACSVISVIFAPPPPPAGQRFAQQNIANKEPVEETPKSPIAK